MKSKELSPKAKDAFAKSLIDTGVAIFKAIMLLVLVFSATLIVRSVSTSPEAEF